MASQPFNVVPLSIAPTELGIFELLVHRPSFGEPAPRLHVSTNAAGRDVPEAMRQTQQFLLSEEVINLGPVDGVTAVPEVPDITDR